MTDLEYFTAIIFIAMTLGVYIYHLVAEWKLRKETDGMLRKGFKELKRQNRL